jgi:hypothetical protein
MTRTAAARLLALAAVSAACSRSPSPVDSEQVIDDPARGVRYTCPAGWRSYEGEIHSPAGSLLTLRVFDLVDADRAFVAGLPDTILRSFWDGRSTAIVEGEPQRAEVAVGTPRDGDYPIRVRPKDRPSKVTCWVVRREPVVCPAGRHPGRARGRQPRSCGHRRGVSRLTCGARRRILLRHPSSVDLRLRLACNPAGRIP